MRAVLVNGLLAVLAATVVTTAVAAAARGLGVDLEIPGSGTIPLSGIAAVTAFFSIVGVVIAAAFARWSTRPAERFLWTTCSLTAVSLVPPLIAGADAGTTIALVVLHLVAAALVIPVVARSLRARQLHAVVGG